MYKRGADGTDGDPHHRLYFLLFLSSLLLSSCLLKVVLFMFSNWKV